MYTQGMLRPLCCTYTSGIISGPVYINFRPGRRTHVVTPVTVMVTMLAAVCTVQSSPPATAPLSHPRPEECQWLRCPLRPVRMAEASRNHPIVGRDGSRSHAIARGPG